MKKLPIAEELMLLHVGRLYEYYMDSYIYSRGKQIHNYFVFKLAWIISEVCIVGLFNVKFSRTCVGADKVNSCGVF